MTGFCAAFRFCLCKREAEDGDIRWLAATASGRDLIVWLDPSRVPDDQKAFLGYGLQHAKEVAGREGRARRGWPRQRSLHGRKLPSQFLEPVERYDKLMALQSRRHEEPALPIHIELGPECPRFEHELRPSEHPAGLRIDWY